MDKKGFIKGVSDNVKVIISRNNKEAFTIQPGNKDWVNIIKYISTTNYVLRPFIIFPRQQIQQSWTNKTMDGNTVIKVLKNGWTN